MGNPRIARLRDRMLTLISAVVAFGLLAGIIAGLASSTTYDAYHTLVDEGAVSVDAALRARAAVLDHMSAAATYLATTGPAHDAAYAQAINSWDTYREQSRLSWRNISDPVQGEGSVYQAADRAASDYIQQIGAMFAYDRAGQKDQAGAAFLAARETLNSRLVPALGGLEAVKVEDMEATYAGAAGRITNWRYAVIAMTVLLSLILLGGLWAVRRMHYRWSWPLGVALLLTIAVGAWTQEQLARAATEARVMVRDAHDTVAGVQDLAALLSQERALQSIAIFDPTHAATHLASFEQYNFLVEQKLCGPTDCTATTFLSGPDTIDPQVEQAALDAQAKFGLPRTPLIANVHFPGQAAEFEALRQAYRTWLDQHRNNLAQALAAGDVDAARTLSTGSAATNFAAVVKAADAVRDTARTRFDDIWRTVYFTSTLDQGLALAFPLAGLLGAWGLWRRRTELFI